ncbi:MAG TPA: sensor domain-containing diguanylate cyclase [Solirubrobacteraceae bacterium]|jgi:diguanylate cyclase (GGDEF)-like protein/PAS domain S-box-containing protein|nr:sensor domain-containing diguanylate cyclase [Solirubrobacteraceae bacterium]
MTIDAQERVSALLKPGLLRRARATKVGLAGLEPYEPGFELAKLQALCFSNAPIGLAVVDQSQKIMVANSAFCALAGRSAEQLGGRHMDDLLAGDDRAAERAQRKRLLSGDVQRYVRDLELQRPDGSSGWVRMTVVGDGENPVSLIYQVEDVAERRRYQEHLEHLVDHDPLTGLFNRRRFDRELEREVARAARIPDSGGALLTLDLDGFKAINDRFGHAVGDALLRGTAEALSARARETDVLARLGGDEFGLLLPGTDRGAAEHVAALVADVVAGYELRVADQAARVTASVGVAMLGSITATELVALADEAMYQAKASDGDQVVVVSRGYVGERSLAARPCQ